MNTIAIPPGMSTRLFVLSSGAINEVPEVLCQAFEPGRRPWVVADENTFDAAGAAVFDVLEKSGLNPLPPQIFPGRPTLHATEELAQFLADAMPENALPVAVGSGTVNDLVKRASGLRQVTYCCVPTACSVDGYTSSGAALTLKGFKQTMPCPPPLAVAADTEVLGTAPLEMLSAGYADLAAKLTGGADWIIADELGIEPIAPTVWELVQRDLKEKLADRNRLDRIFAGLAATGYAMQMYRESRPASGAEHLFSHVWEMENLTFKGETVSHGFKVGIGTLATTLLQEFITEHSASEARRLAAPAPDRPRREAEINRLISGGNYGAAKKVALDKFLEGQAADDRRELIFSRWDHLALRLKTQLLPYDELRRRFAAAECPCKPADIGLGRDQFLHGIFAAQLIRKRYTVLDLLYETGLLEAAAARLDRMF